MSSSLTASKRQLRAVMKSRLSAVSSESVATQSRLVFETLSTFQPYKDARRISVYLSMPGSEIQTDAIVRDALASGKQVYVPYLHKSQSDSLGTPSRVMDMVQLKNILDYESLKPDRWGIPSIDPSTVDERQRILGPETSQQETGATLDLMLLPGVAFNVDQVSGLISRLGHGKGFYDYFTHRYMSNVLVPGEQGEPRSILLYGLALKEQFLCQPQDNLIPVGPLDQPLHGIIRGDGVITSGSVGSKS